VEKSIFAEIGLEKLPFYGKVFISMFLVCIGCGYLMAILNVLSNVGLNYNSIVDHYRGNEANMIVAPDFNELVAHAHTHILGMTGMFFTLGIVFMLTGVPAVYKAVVPAISFLAILLDISSMFLVRFVLPQFAITILLAGMTIGICALIEIAVPFYEMWIKEMWLRRIKK
jgi:hypothetical protein